MKKFTSAFGICVTCIALGLASSASGEGQCNRGPLPGADCREYQFLGPIVGVQWIQNVVFCCCQQLEAAAAAGAGEGELHCLAVECISNINCFVGSQRVECRRMVPCNRSGRSGGYGCSAIEIQLFLPIQRAAIQAVEDIRAKVDMLTP